MCGFVGFLGGLAADGPLSDGVTLLRMTDTIANHEPDDAGYWLAEELRVGFGCGSNKKSVYEYKGADEFQA